MNPTMRTLAISLLVVATTGVWAQTATNSQPAKPATNKGGTNVAAKAPSKPTPPPPFVAAEADLAKLASQAAALGQNLNRLKELGLDDDLISDIEVFHKAIAFSLRRPKEEFFSAKFVGDAYALLDAGLKRAKAMEAGMAPWRERKGMIVRGYRSAVDSSVQPYALTIPSTYDGKRPMRLDVILHGRGATLSEIGFMGPRENTNAPPDAPDYIRLEVYGRWNNAFRFSGETDVFEAIAAVKRNYRIDERRMVLRGFSMGGAGAWHLGLHHPSLWAAVEAGAGFTDTVRFAKLTNLPPWQTRVLGYLDPEPAALNALNMPVVGYGGELDKQKQATDNIRLALEGLGLVFEPRDLDFTNASRPILFLTGPKTAHRWHSNSKAQSDAFIDHYLALPPKGLSEVHFTTATLRYDRCGPLTITGLKSHGTFARIDAKREGSVLKISIFSNVTAFTWAGEGIQKVTLGANTLEVKGKGPVSLVEGEGGWSFGSPTNVGLRKKHGLQGPIDDAFMSPFVAIPPEMPADEPLCETYQREARLSFSNDFAVYLRGDIPQMRATEITPDIMRGKNLILFGDPKTQPLLARMAQALPLKWQGNDLVFGGNAYPASNHVVVFIFPNPLAPGRYVVLNTGHTITEADWKGSNALQFAKLGDWAVIKLSLNEKQQLTREVVTAGFFNEKWGLGE